MSSGDPESTRHKHLERGGCSHRTSNQVGKKWLSHGDGKELMVKLHGKDREKHPQDVGFYMLIS